MYFHIYYTKCHGIQKYLNSPNFGKSNILQFVLNDNLKVLEKNGKGNF